QGGGGPGARRGRLPGGGGGGYVRPPVGPPGWGKRTLLYTAGLPDPADVGEVWIAGREGAALPDQERSALRSLAMGFVYQYHHLLREFSALENVVLPQMIAGRSRRDAGERARALLAMVGLAERADHRPAERSGGGPPPGAAAR